MKKYVILVRKMKIMFVFKLLAFLRQVKNCVYKFKKKLKIE